MLDFLNLDGKPAMEAISYLVSRHYEIAYISCIDFVPTQTHDDWKNEGTHSREEIVAHSRKHETKGRNWHRLPRTLVTPNKLLNIANALAEDRVLAVASRVILRDGRRRHIPMLDFQCERTSATLKSVIRLMTGLDEAGGIILTTAKSYHYYGVSLLTEGQWRKFSGECLLLDCDADQQPYVDIRYLGHRLQEGWGSLRISEDRHPCHRRECPRVVGFVPPRLKGEDTPSLHRSQ